MHGRSGLATLFADSQQTSPDWQRIACALAAGGAFQYHHRVGPLPGKTTNGGALAALLQTPAVESRAGHWP